MTRSAQSPRPSQLPPLSPNLNPNHASLPRIGSTASLIGSAYRNGSAIEMQSFDPLTPEKILTRTEDQIDRKNHVQALEQLDAEIRDGGSRYLELQKQALHSLQTSLQVNGDCSVRRHAAQLLIANIRRHILLAEIGSTEPLAELFKNSQLYDAVHAGDAAHVGGGGLEAFCSLHGILDREGELIVDLVAAFGDILSPRRPLTDAEKAVNDHRGKGDLPQIAKHLRKYRKHLAENLKTLVSIRDLLGYVRTNIGGTNFFTNEVLSNSGANLGSMKREIKREIHKIERKRFRKQTHPYSVPAGEVEKHLKSLKQKLKQVSPKFERFSHGDIEKACTRRQQAIDNIETILYRWDAKTRPSGTATRAALADLVCSLLHLGVSQQIGLAVGKAIKEALGLGSGWAGTLTEALPAAITTSLTHEWVEKNLRPELGNGAKVLTILDPDKLCFKHVPETGENDIGIRFVIGETQHAAMQAELEAQKAKVKTAIEKRSGGLEPGSLAFNLTTLASFAIGNAITAYLLAKAGLSGLAMIFTQILGKSATSGVGGACRSVVMDFTMTIPKVNIDGEKFYLYKADENKRSQPASLSEIGKNAAKTKFPPLLASESIASKLTADLTSPAAKGAIQSLLVLGLFLAALTADKGSRNESIRLLGVLKELRSSKGSGHAFSSEDHQYLNLIERSLHALIGIAGGVTHLPMDMGSIAVGAVLSKVELQRVLQWRASDSIALPRWHERRDSAPPV